MISRRRFLELGVASAAVAASGGYAHASVDHPFYRRLGFQTYTVASAIQRDPAGTLERLASAGYREVELHSLDLGPTLAPISREVGLRIIGSHIPTLFRDDDAWSRWLQDGPKQFPEGFAADEIIERAQGLGVKYLGYADVPPRPAMVDVASFRRFADVFDRFGQHCRSAGIRLAYHNHFQEFAAVGAPGEGTFLDVLIRHCEPRNVAFEVDVCWAAHAGQDPVALINTLAGRVPLLHLKDRLADAPRGTAGVWPKQNIFTEVGSGALDMPAILRAAHASGVEHVFVEQDRTHGDPINSLIVSHRYVTQQRL